MSILEMAAPRLAAKPRRVYCVESGVNFSLAVGRFLLATNQVGRMKFEAVALNPKDKRPAAKANEGFYSKMFSPEVNPMAARGVDGVDVVGNMGWYSYRLTEYPLSKALISAPGDGCGIFVNVWANVFEQANQNRTLTHVARRDMIVSILGDAVKLKAYDDARRLNIYAQIPTHKDKMPRIIDSWGEERRTAVSGFIHTANEIGRHLARISV